MRYYQKSQANGESITQAANDGMGAVHETLTGATTLTMADSGKIFTFLGATTGAAITLPAVATSSGFEAEFWVGAAFASTAWTIVAATAKIQGSAIVNSTIVGCVDQSIITFAHGAETKGDWLSISCNGTNWYVKGVATAAGGITFTTP